MTTPFLNKSNCTKICAMLRSSEGLENLDAISSKIAVSPEKCEMAADFFETAGEKGGNYFCNIINYPLFSNEETRVIFQHVYNLISSSGYSPEDD